VTAPGLAVSHPVIRDVIRRAALEVPGVLRVGRGGPAWRRALSGRSVGIRIRDGAVEARVGRILELSAPEGWLEDPDAVHDARVASRRLRAALDLADPEVYPAFRKHRTRAVRLTRALGCTRELDVHLDRLASLGAGLTAPGGHEVREHALESFDRRRRKARRSMTVRVGRLKLEDFRGLLDLKALPRPFVSAGLEGAVSALLSPLLPPALSPLEEALDTEDAPRLHRMRIEVKKLRYALEILGPAFPAPPEPWLARLRDLQTVLGDHHDWTLLETGLWRWSQHPNYFGDILAWIGIYLVAAETHSGLFALPGRGFSKRAA